MFQTNDLQISDYDAGDDDLVVSFSLDERFAKIRGGAVIVDVIFVDGIFAESGTLITGVNIQIETPAARNAAAL